MYYIWEGNEMSFKIYIFFKLKKRLASLLYKQNGTIERNKTSQASQEPKSFIVLR